MVDLSQPNALRESCVYLEVVILEVDLNLNLPFCRETLSFRFRRACDWGCGSPAVFGVSHLFISFCSLLLTTDYSSLPVKRAVCLWFSYCYFYAVKRDVRVKHLFDTHMHISPT